MDHIWVAGTCAQTQASPGGEGPHIRWKPEFGATGGLAQRREHRVLHVYIYISSICIYVYV